VLAHFSGGAAVANDVDVAPAGISLDCSSMLHYPSFNIVQLCTSEKAPSIARIKYSGNGKKCVGRVLLENENLIINAYKQHYVHCFLMTR